MTRHILILLGALALSSASASTITTYAGTGAKGLSGDGGLATMAKLNNVYGVARGPDGMIYFCDMDNHRVRRIKPDGTVETYAGCDKRGHDGDGGPATEASLNMPYEIAFDRRGGNLYIVELGNHDVRRVDAKTQKIRTVAGTGQPGFSGDGGPSTKAQFNQPHCLAFDKAGDLFICDVRNHRIRKIDMRTGVISTWCGTGEPKTAEDGSPITGSPLQGPRAMAFGRDGKCYVALREGNAVLLLDPKANTIHRFAGINKEAPRKRGVPAPQPFTGNRGPALEATLSGPKCISLDAAGNVYIADTESHCIRYIDVKTGIIDVLAGTGQQGDGPDGDPLSCKLARPHGIFVDKDGSVFIGDSENHRVRVWKK